MKLIYLLEPYLQHPNSFNCCSENACSCDIYLPPHHGTMVPVSLLSEEQWYCIALWGYLYRSKDENGSTPKGSPIPVATTHAWIISNDHVGHGNGEFSIVYDLLPDGCNPVFEDISSIGTTQYFAVESREEALIWVNSLHQMRQDAIT